MQKTPFFEFPSGNNRKSKIQNRKWAGFLATLVLLLGYVGIAGAQQPKKVPRIGFVSSGSASVRIDALRQGLREFGWIEGTNIVIERRQAEGKSGRVPALAAELVRLKVDVLVLSGGVAAAEQIKTMPIVFVATADLVSTGLVQSLARPGGNVTGLTSLAPELGGKRLELLKEAVPKLSRVAFLFNPDEPSNVVELEQLRGAAAALEITLRAVEARSRDDIERAFVMMTRERVEGLSTASGAVNNTNRRRIVELVVKKRLPAVYHESQFVDDGGLMSYGANLAGMFRRAAYFVDKILKGAKPADLPVEQPTKFEFIINLKTAKQIGLTIPPNVLARADRIIR
ncbi:MAG TPA: ABC transporter substrate-binding protein [Candidatus Binatia bacterium]|nr:ABC transporter substrate-binding protein [Candidatus Binatia bacterium]